MYEELLDELIKLQELINQSREEKMKILEAYKWFVTKRGRDCTYAKKCVAMFKTNMYAEVKNRIYNISRIINELENGRT